MRRMTAREFRTGFHKLTEPVQVGSGIWIPGIAFLADVIDEFGDFLPPRKDPPPTAPAGRPVKPKGKPPALDAGAMAIEPAVLTIPTTTSTSATWDFSKAAAEMEEHRRQTLAAQEQRDAILRKLSTGKRKG